MNQEGEDFDFPGFDVRVSGARTSETERGVSRVYVDEGTEGVYVDEVGVEEHLGVRVDGGHDEEEDVGEGVECERGPPQRPINPLRHGTYKTVKARLRHI